MSFFEETPEDTSEQVEVSEALETLAAHLIRQGDKTTTDKFHHLVMVLKESNYMGRVRPDTALHALCRKVADG